MNKLNLNNINLHAPYEVFLQTLTAIIEEFFTCNNDVMLYIAETGDGKQKFRNRLFVIWFNTYQHRSDYVLVSILFDTQT